MTTVGQGFRVVGVLAALVAGLLCQTGTAADFTRYTLLSASAERTAKAVLEDGGKTLRLVYDTIDYGEEDEDWFAAKRGTVRISSSSTVISRDGILYGRMRELDAYLYLYAIEKIVVDSSFAFYRPTYACGWFAGFPALTSIEGLENFNTSQISDMTAMFFGCTSLETLDLSSFDTSNAYDMDFMFGGCKALASVNLSSFNTVNVSSFGYVFNNCEALTTVDLSSFDTSRGKSFYDMFEYCQNLETIYASEKFVTTNAYSSADSMFSGCYKLVGGAGTTYYYIHRNNAYARLDTPDAPGYFTAKSAILQFVDKSTGSDSNDGFTYLTPKKTIAAAVSAASEGGSVYVSTGVYDPISTANKKVSIVGWNRTGDVVIDGGNSQRCATLGTSTNECRTILSKLTLRNGFTTEGGAGARGGTLQNCVISNCVASGNYGGGAFMSSLDDTVVEACEAKEGGGIAYSIANRCVVRQCRADDNGGGAWHCVLNNSLLYANYAGNTGGSGSGYGCSDCLAYNCTIADNTGASGGGVAASSLYNCIVYNNMPVNVYPGGGDPASALSNCYTSDPSFRDAANGDYRLMSDSPCLDAGNNAYVVGSCDLSGRGRIVDGIVDLGCYELRDYLRVLDFSGSAVFNDEDTAWTIDTNVWAVGGSALRTETIGDNESTSVSVTIQGEGLLTFDWKVESEENSDYFWCYVDGIARKIRSGIRDWRTAVVYVEGTGTHQVEWRYAKNASYTSGSDCAWLDHLTWTPGAEDPGVRSIVYNKIEWRYCIRGSVASLGGDSSDWTAIDDEFTGSLYSSGYVPTSIEGCPVRMLGDYAFYRCNAASYGWQYDFPVLSQIVSIGRSAFEGCTKLKGLTIQPAVTNIGDRAFAGCAQFVNMTIPETVLSYGTDVLTGCTNLNEVVFSAYLANALKFSNCPNLKTIRYYGDRALPTGSYGAALPGAKLYVTRTSTGWGCAIPGTWCGLPIDYLDALSSERLSAADFDGEGALTDAGSPYWMVSTNSFVSGGSALRSGKMTESGKTSGLTLTVEGKGTLSYMWKIRSSSTSSKLRCLVDGVEYCSINSWTDWDEVKIDIETEGSHEITWEYYKGSSYAYYEDCGWIDCLSWTPGEITLGRDVLLWAPSMDNTTSGTQVQNLVPKLLNVLREAYETRIPDLYASSYTNGIVVKVVSGTNYSPASLPGNLSRYGLVFVVLPHNIIEANEVNRLKTVVARGGRVVLQAEHALFSATENARLTKLAADMGADFSILEGQKAGTDFYNESCNLLSQPTALAELPESKSVAPISYSGVAQQVACLSTDSSYVWAVDEVSGNGRITVFSDNNWYCDSGTSSGTLYEDSIPLLERLLANAIKNEQAVIDEEDPNEDIEETVPDWAVCAVRDHNDFQTYYSNIVDACSYASAGYAVTNRLTVVLKKEYFESFTLPEGVTFETIGICSNYDSRATISVPSGCDLSVNAAHDIFKSLAVRVPDTPVISATDGTYTNCVEISWSVPDSEKPIVAYEVKRVKVGSTLETTLSSAVPTNFYRDVTCKPGVHYHYYVRAQSSAGWGYYSEKDEGWRSASAEAEVVNVTARQRYPWNGKVDVDFEITGDPDATYRVGLTVRDVAGGTNLTVRTVEGEALVSPGRHRLVWNADADISADVELPRIKVTVTAAEE